MSGAPDGTGERGSDPAYFRRHPPEFGVDVRLVSVHRCRMPEISRFFGIIIAMYYNDQSPPHFHARYGEYEIKVAIESGDVLDGVMPQRAKRLIMEWWCLHRVELAEDWKLAEERRPLKRIEPLE